MRKFLTGMAAVSALALFASAAQAACPGNHNVTASAPQSQRAVAVSTYDGATATTVAEEEKATEAAASCANGDKDCKTPATE